jgi:hypothetical protein
MSDHSIEDFKAGDTRKRILNWYEELDGDEKIDTRGKVAVMLIHGCIF